MDLGKLHQYLGELLEVGTDPRMPIVLPGQHREALPEELSGAMLIEGLYQADPAPLAKGYTELQGACLLLHGVGFDLDNLSGSHSSDWPIVEAP